MYKNHNSFVDNLGVIALCFVSYLHMCKHYFNAHADPSTKARLELTV